MAMGLFFWSFVNDLIDLGGCNGRKMEWGGERERRDII
jgi:hypothetical protein